MVAVVDGHRRSSTAGAGLRIVLLILYTIPPVGPPTYFFWWSAVEKTGSRQHVLFLEIRLFEVSSIVVPT